MPFFDFQSCFVMWRASLKARNPEKISKRVTQKWLFGSKVTKVAKKDANVTKTNLKSDFLSHS